MRILKKPSADPLEVFSLCVSGVTDVTENARLTKIAELITEAGVRYDKYASVKQFYLLTRELTVGGTVTIEEMKALYSSSMSRASGAARRVYDEILNAAPNSICPQCGIGTVRSLDHYLPQSKYPEYVVMPANLIPSCFDCNKAKFAKFPKQAAEQTIHPYFDNYTQETWLRAEVIEAGPPALRFYADGPSHWSPIDRARVKYHFEVLKLGKLYAANAGNELGNIRSLLVNRLAGDEKAIRLHLEEQATTCRDAYVNSWQTAAYEALSTSAWFIEDGFREIPGP